MGSGIRHHRWTSELVLAVGDVASFQATFADTGSLDTHGARWDFRRIEGTQSIAESRTGTVNAITRTVEDEFSFA